MWRRIIVSGEAAGGAPRRSWRMLATKSKPAANSKPSSIGATASSSAAVDSLILRSLKDHYLEVSKMVPPPVTNLPSPTAAPKKYTFFYPLTVFVRVVVEGEPAGALRHREGST